MWFVAFFLCILFIIVDCIYIKKTLDRKQKNPDIKNKEIPESFQQFLLRNNLNANIIIGDHEKPYLAIDSQNKVFVVNKKIFEFGELIDYKLSVTYSQKTNNDTRKRATMGGLLFGTGGALVGAATAKTKSYEVCNGVSIILSLNNAQNLTETIIFPFSFDAMFMDWKRNAETPELLSQAEKCTAALEIIKKENQKQEQTAKEDKNSIVYKLERISELYQNGTITEAEFNKLKEGLIDGKW